MAFNSLGLVAATVVVVVNLKSISGFQIKEAQPILAWKLLRQETGTFS